MEEQDFAKQINNILACSRHVQVGFLCRFHDPTLLLGRGRYSNVYKCWARFGVDSSAFEAGVETHMSTYVVKVLDQECHQLATKEAELLHRLFGARFVVKFYGLYNEQDFCRFIDRGELYYRSFDQFERCLVTHYPGREKWLMLLEHCSNGDVLEFVRKNSSLITPTLVYKWAHQLSAALVELYRNRIIHRDIKPHNVLVTEQLDLRLADFNHGTSLSSNQSRKEYLQGLGYGTPNFVAPEILLKQDYDFTIDIYAFGIFVYYIVTRNEPFKDVINSTLLLESIKKGFFVSGHNTWGNAGNFETRVLLQDLEFMSVVEQCLDKCPASRPNVFALHEFCKARIQSCRDFSWEGIGK